MTNVTATHPVPEPWIEPKGVTGLVSYIVPAYNVAAYIQDTLDSCLLQDYRPLQIVVVDDGSTDDTAALVRQFQLQHGTDDFEVQLVSQVNAGLNAARNAGLRASTGSLIGLLDADDMLPATRTSHLCEHLQRLDGDLVYGPCARFRERSEIEHYLHPASEPAAADNVQSASCLPVGKWIPNVWSFLARREFLAGVGPLTEHLRLCWPDLDYTVRIRHTHPRMYSTNRVVNLYRQVPGSNADRTRPEAIADAIRAVQTIEQLFQESGIDEPESWRWLGAYYWTTARWALRANMGDEAMAALRGASQHCTTGRKSLSSLLTAVCHVPGACTGIARAAQVIARLKTVRK